MPKNVNHYLQLSHQDAKHKVMHNLSPQNREVMKIEKNMEEKCNAHYEKFQKRCIAIEERCDELESVIDEKFSKVEIDKTCT